MSHGISKILQNVTPLLVLLVLAILAHVFTTKDQFLNLAYFSELPLVVLTIAIFLCWKFKQIHGFYFLLLCCLSYAVLYHFNPYPIDLTSYPTQLIAAIFSLLLPINLLLSNFWKPVSGISLLGFSRLFFIIAQFTGITWLFINEQPELLSYLNFPKTSLASILPDTYPDLAILTIPLLLITQLILIIKKPSYLLIYQHIACLGLFFSIAFPDGYHIVILMFLIIGLSFSIAVIQESYEMAYIDTLTRLPGRRTMEDEMQKLSGRFCIAMLDIDHFKKLNDNYGHDVGDQVLRMVAKNIRRVGGGGKPCRYGGEEFSIIFPGKMVSQVMPFLEILRDEIATTPFALRNKNRPKEIPKERLKKKAPSKLITVTVSIGVADSPKRNADSYEVLKTADKALYKAKKLGRNRTMYIKNTAME